MKNIILMTQLQSHQTNNQTKKKNNEGYSYKFQMLCLS